MRVVKRRRDWRDSRGEQVNRSVPRGTRRTCVSCRSFHTCQGAVAWAIVGIEAPHQSPHERQGHCLSWHGNISRERGTQHSHVLGVGRRADAVEVIFAVAPPSTDERLRGAEVRSGGFVHVGTPPPTTTMPQTVDF